MAATMLGKRSGRDELDGHGTRASTQFGPLQAVKPGTVLSEPPGDGEKDGPGTSVLAVDPALWPLTARDLVVEPGSGRQWVVISAEHRKHAVERSLDWVRVEGRAL